MSIKKAIKLSKNDFNRVVLMDVLPYELPFILTNEGFYSLLNNNSKKINCFISNDFFLKELFFSDNVTETYPLDYKITKDQESERVLSLIHPKAQIKFIKLYKDYYQFMIYSCSKSSYSLRYPYELSYLYIEKEKKFENQIDQYKDEGINLEDSEPIYTSSFFEYKQYSFLYKFYDSYEFHKIEKKFNHLFKFDIAKCFSSISTFQISKSLKGVIDHNSSKNFHSFEKKFEDIMLFSNAANSHGIVIGPEFSRIFSEIILQNIDFKIKSKLDRLGIYEGQDYIIKRYVDDYFLFYNNKAIKKQVHKNIIEMLSEISLFSNDAKNIEYNIPFITGVTRAKSEINTLLSNFFERNFNSEENLNKGSLNFYYKISNNLISQIKCIVYDNKVQYSSITGYFFTIIKRNIVDITSKIKNYDLKDMEVFTRKILIILDLAFFVYSMDFRVRSTYLISQIVILINELTLNFKAINEKSVANDQDFLLSETMDNSYDRIKKKIYDEVTISLKNAIGKGQARYMESLNLLIAIRDIDRQYNLPELLLSQIVGISLDDIEDYEKDVNYFQLMITLFYMYRNKKNYPKLNKKIKNIIIKKLSDNQVSIFNSSELIHLFFDSLSCPTISETDKKAIFNVIYQKNKDKIKDPDELFNYITQNKWFIDWDTTTIDSIKKLLMKKELRQAYGN